MRPATAKYLALINEFPLVPIRDPDTYEQAVALSKKLRDQNVRERLTVREYEYLEVLERLIEGYAPQKRHPFSGDPLNTLVKLMNEQGLSPAALIELSGEHKTNVSAFLNGHRNISKSVAKKLADHFNVEPEVFLPKIEMSARAEIYLSGGIFDGLHTVKLLMEKIGPILKSGQYELVPYSYKAGFPPYYPLFVWVPKPGTQPENIARLEFEIKQTYIELTEGASTYHPNNLEERLEHCRKLIERLDTLDSPACDVIEKPMLSELKCRTPATREAMPEANKVVSKRRSNE